LLQAFEESASWALCFMFTGYIYPHILGTQSSSQPKWQKLKLL